MFLPGSKQWDLIKVINLFTSCDAKTVLTLPIPTHQIPDHIAWMLTNDMKYSVKSGYKFWYENHNDCIRIEGNPGWENLWKFRDTTKNENVPLAILQK